MANRAVPINIIISSIQNAYNYVITDLIRNRRPDIRLISSRYILRQSRKSSAILRPLNCYWINSGRTIDTPSYILTCAD